jgi:hypothetical protein
LPLRQSRSNSVSVRGTPDTRATRPRASRGVKRHRPPARSGGARSLRPRHSRVARTARHEARGRPRTLPRRTCGVGVPAARRPGQIPIGVVASAWGSPRIMRRTAAKPHHLTHPGRSSRRSDGSTSRSGWRSDRPPRPSGSRASSPS